jgi:hypothetical protein
MKGGVLSPVPPHLALTGQAQENQWNKLAFCVGPIALISWAKFKDNSDATL